MALVLTLVASVTANACPRPQPEQFPEFLSQFTSSMDFALSRTSFPLPASELDFQAQPEPVPKPFKLTREVFKERGTIAMQVQKHGLKVTQRSLSRTDAKVHVHKPDTGWRVVYHFRLRDNCWRLRRIDDEST